MAINSIAIKQIIGAWAFDSSEEIKWMCSQVQNLQITQDGETTEKQDANGSTIFSIDRNKSCLYVQFSGINTLLQFYSLLITLIRLLWHLQQVPERVRDRYIRHDRILLL